MQTLSSRSPGAVEDKLIRPILSSGKGFYVTVTLLGLIIAWAAYAWSVQLRQGLGVAGINRPVFWAVYITNFVFYIGISHAGTLISAILRVTHARWRRPITRAAEAITVFALMIGPGFIIVHLGRPQLFWRVLTEPNFSSPLLWDVICISTYLLASITYLYLPLIPDLALLRDRGVRPLWLYRRLSAGYRGSDSQKRRLEKAINVMAVAIIPIAVSVHTVVSWVFAMTLSPMWHSTIFGPYFVVGAIFSGIAALILAMAILRKAYHLEEFLTARHFNNLGLLLLTMTCLWFYFTLAEYLTTYYGNLPEEMAVFWSKFTGEFAPLFWTMVVCCFVVPFPILAMNRTRTVTGTVIASIAVNIGMWLERYTIIVPTLSHPRLTFNWGNYAPTWVEISITAGAVGLFALLYVLFSKFFPIISIWELEAARESGNEQVS